jgi:prevent-host-death family protein
MSTHSIAEAQQHLPELIDRVCKGEDVVITSDGQPVAELKSMPAKREPRPMTDADWDWLAARRVGRGKHREDAGTFVSRMRDEEWERF